MQDVASDMKCEMMESKCCNISSAWQFFGIYANVATDQLNSMQTITTKSRRSIITLRVETT
jgi:hypothetical protein